MQKILTEAARQLNLVKGQSCERDAAGAAGGLLDRLHRDGFTEIRYASGNRTAHLMAVADIESRYVVGWALGASANHTLAL